MTKSREIIGHKKQILQLEQDLSTGNLSHAYLFAGSPHVGKTTLAHWFARKILTRTLQGEAMETALHQMDKLVHPDLLVLDQLWMEERMEDWDEIAKSSNFPQQHRAKAGTKTDIISIDDVREVQQRLQETGDLPNRVCIIRGIERMQDGAANAFLKILEEPPEGRVFILTTESLSSVLPTVLSRTRVLRMERAADRDLQILLKDMPEEDSLFIIHVAQGAPGVAMRLMSDPEALQAERILHTQAASFWGASTLLERLNHLEPLAERGTQAERFMFHLALALRMRPDYEPAHERVLTELVKGLKTNAHRVLQIQNFAMSNRS